MRTEEYDQDVVAWAKEQARLIRTRQFDQLDIDNVAEEIEDVGKSEQRELASRMAILLAHLLKWQYQPKRQKNSLHTANSWQVTIRTQRHSMTRRLKRMPSLKPMLSDDEWQEDIWEDAIDQATQETGLDCFPSTCPWTSAQILDEAWLPEPDAKQPE